MENKKLKDQTEKMRKWAKENGIKIVDITNPENPTMTAVFKPKPKKEEKK